MVVCRQVFVRHHFLRKNGLAGVCDVIINNKPRFYIFYSKYLENWLPKTENCILYPPGETYIHLTVTNLPILPEIYRFSGFIVCYLLKIIYKHFLQYNQLKVFTNLF